MGGQLYKAYPHATNKGYNGNVYDLIYWRLTQIQAQYRVKASPQSFEKLDKLVYSQLSLPKDASQGSSIKGFVITNNNLTEGLVPSHHDMTPLPPFDVKPCLH